MLGLVIINWVKPRNCVSQNRLLYVVLGHKNLSEIWEVEMKQQVLLLMVKDWTEVTVEHFGDGCLGVEECIKSSGCFQVLQNFTFYQALCSVP